VELLGSAGGGGKAVFLAEVVDGMDVETDFCEEAIVVKFCK
jgi:hypothetical protein